MEKFEDKINAKFQSAFDALEKRIDMKIKSPVNFYANESQLIKKYSPVEASIVSESDFKKYQQKAALSSWFSPDKLFASNESKDSKMVVLNILDGLCEKRKTDKIEWQLKKSRRTYVINELINTQQLKNALAENLPETDETGEAMRRVLGGNDSNIDDLTENQALDLIGALELISDTEIVRQPIEDVRDKIQGKFLSEYDVLLQHYVGRVQMLADLHDFLNKPSRKHDFDTIVVTGTGGAGKSTLLAKFLQEVRDNNTATIAILDFDKPGVDPDDKNWLLSEMINQVGRQYPQIRMEINHGLDRLREESNERERYSFKKEFTSEDLRRQMSIIFPITAALTAIGANRRPWLIVFDTFEEVKTDLRRETLITWLHTLADMVSEIPFKVIISGRLFGKDTKFKSYDGEAAVITVEEFDSDVAMAFLEHLGLPNQTIHGILKDSKIPLRPLELKLLAGLFEDPSFSLEELKAETANSKFAGKDLFLGIVYRRVLARIGDATARKLAYPGLVLRYLTVPIIQNILVPTIHKLASEKERQGQKLTEDEQPIGQLTNEEMKKSLDELADRGWLSYRGVNDEVFHQKYLRRSMLRLMITRDPDKAKQIHKAAILYFSEFVSNDARAEVLYHELMLYNASEDFEFRFDSRAIRLLLPHINVDLEDLPRPAAILIQYVESGEVAEEDMRFLPKQYFNEASLTSLKKYNSNREYLAGIQFISHRFPNTREMNEAALEPLFKTVEWNWLKKVIRPTVGRDPGNRILDETFYMSFVDYKIAKKEVESQAFESALRMLITKNEKRATERNTVSRITHLATIYDPLIKSPGNKLQSLLNDFLKINNNSTDKNPLRVGAVNLLRLLCQGGKRESTFIPGLIRIDKPWLNRMSEYLGGTRQLMEEVRGCFNSVTTCAAVLGKIDGISRKLKSSFNVPVKAGAIKRDTFISLLRGPDPEFRDLCRYAIIEIYDRGLEPSQLASIITSVISLDVEDFTPNITLNRPDDKTTLFTLSMARNAEKSLEEYIEFVDRSWALGDLMAGILKLQPDAPKLKMVYNRYLIWDQAVRNSIGYAYDTELEKSRNKKHTKKMSPKNRNKRK